jgi:hypothetical protein
MPVLSLHSALLSEKVEGEGNHPLIGLIEEMERIINYFCYGHLAFFTPFKPQFFLSISPSSMVLIPDYLACLRKFLFESLCPIESPTPV